MIYQDKRVERVQLRFTWGKREEASDGKRMFWTLLFSNVVVTTVGIVS
jgi:hypothetical protein